MKGAKDMIDSRNKRSNKKKITFHKSINGKKNIQIRSVYICIYAYNSILPFPHVFANLQKRGYASSIMYNKKYI